MHCVIQYWPIRTVFKFKNLKLTNENHIPQRPSFESISSHSSCVSISCWSAISFPFLAMAPTGAFFSSPGYKPKVGDSAWSHFVSGTCVCFLHLIHNVVFFRFERFWLCIFVILVCNTHIFNILGEYFHRL